MDLFEGLSIAVALLAASIALVAPISNRRHSSRIEELEAEQIELARRQMELHEELARYELEARQVEKEERERADVRLRIEGSDRVRITNVGRATATDFDMTIFCHDGVTSAFLQSEAERYLPRKKLYPGDDFTLALGLSHDCHRPLTGQAAWTDPDGTRQTREFTL